MWGDERGIYGIPRGSRSGGSNLYSYEIATGAVTLVGALERAIYTGSHMRDSRGNIYFARFGDGESWEGKARLTIVHPSGIKRTSPRGATRSVASRRGHAISTGR